MTQPLRVMLIDDSQTDLTLAEEAFALVDQPCLLITVPSGTAALEALTAPDATLPDLVLLDINMPGMNGFTVLERLKAHPRLKSLPVVMLTTSTAEEDIQQAYQLHASAYLPKPVAFERFFEQVQCLVAFWTSTSLTTRPTALDPGAAPSA